MKLKLYDVGPKLTIEQITEIETTIGHPLPKQYKDFMMQFNGGSTGLQNCFKIHYSGQAWADDVETALLDNFYSIPEHQYYGFLDNYRGNLDRIPTDTIAIACDQGRSLILLGVEGENTGKIFYWNGEYQVDDYVTMEEGFQPDYENVGFVANSFNDFLKGLHISEFETDEEDDETYPPDGLYEIS